MERRHENSLTNLLEVVAFEGYADVAKWKLARWYGQSNFTINIRRDLRERWDNLLSEELKWSHVPPLMLAEIGGKIILMKKSDFFPEKE